LISSNWIPLSKCLVKVLGVWFLKTISRDWTGTASFDWTFRPIGTIPTVLSSIANHLLMSLLSSVLPSYYRRLDNPLAVVCLVPLIYLTSKSNSWIYTSQRVTRAPGKSVAALLSCIISVLASSLRIKWTPYSQNRTFCRHFTSPRYSLLVVSYLYSVLFQISDSYHTTLFFPLLLY
jgi:hypothetical protein